MNEFLSLEEVRKTFVERRSLMDEKKIDEVLGFSSKRDKILSLFSVSFLLYHFCFSKFIIYYITPYVKLYMPHKHSLNLYSNAHTPNRPRLNQM